MGRKNPRTIIYEDKIFKNDFCCFLGARAPKKYLKNHAFSSLGIDTFIEII
jgi:hypothetical protein